MNDLIRVDNHLRGELESRVKESYRSEIRRFLDFAETHGLSIDTVTEYLKKLKESGQSVSTINKHIAAVKNCVRTLFNFPSVKAMERFRVEGALKEIKLLKRAKNANVVGADKVLNPEEIEVLILKSSQRLSLLISFLAKTGTRISEACGVKLSSCSTENGKTNVQVIGKGEKARTVSIPTRLFRAIRREYDGTIYLFETRNRNLVNDRNVYKEIVRVGRHHLNRHVTPHMLRHTFATETIRRTGKRKAVSEYLGHSSTAITEDMYNHETLDDEDLGILP